MSIEKKVEDQVDDLIPGEREEKEAKKWNSYYGSNPNYWDDVYDKPPITHTFYPRLYQIKQKVSVSHQRIANALYDNPPLIVNEATGILGYVNKEVLDTVSSALTKTVGDMLDGADIAWDKFGSQELENALRQLILDYGLITKDGLNYYPIMEI